MSSVESQYGGYRASSGTTVSKPQFSIITVVYNGANYIEDTIKSVLAQSVKDVEYIIIDGGSTDGTIEIIKRYEADIAYWISEPDKGIYDGMNKGIRMATGHYIGILNSDDYYQDDFVLERINEAFLTSGARCVFAHVRFINPSTRKTVRVYNSKANPEKLFRWGYMPAHPTFFAQKDDYQKYGLYKTDYRIAADYELLIRYLWKYKLSYKRLDEVIIVMRTGGASTDGIKSTLLLNKEIIRACKENGINTNYFMLSLKYFTKVIEFVPMIINR